MSKMHKFAALLVALFAATLSLTLGTANAGADPSYPPGSPTAPSTSTTGGTSTTGSLSDPNPGPGETITVSAGGFLAGESVSFDLYSTVVHLGASNADASGVAALPVTIPSDFSGSHHITLTGATSGRVVSISFSIDSSKGGGSGGSGGTNGGGLSATGVAVAGIGVLGAVLLVGGVMLLVAGRRKPLPVRTDS